MYCWATHITTMKRIVGCGCYLVVCFFECVLSRWPILFKVCKFQWDRDFMQFCCTAALLFKYVGGGGGLRLCLWSSWYHVHH